MDEDHSIKGPENPSRNVFENFLTHSQKGVPQIRVQDLSEIEERVGFSPPVENEDNSKNDLTLSDISKKNIFEQHESIFMPVVAAVESSNKNTEIVEENRMGDSEARTAQISTSEEETRRN